MANTNIDTIVMPSLSLSCYKVFYFYIKNARFCLPWRNRPHDIVYDTGDRGHLTSCGNLDRREYVKFSWVLSTVF